MSGLTETRSSTQDNSSGVQVATSVNELDGTGALQAVVPSSNKTTFSEVGRTTISVTDASTFTDLTTTGFATALIDCGNAASVSVRAWSSAASTALQGRLVWYDVSANPLSFSETFYFTSDPAMTTTLTVSAGVPKYPCQRYIVDAGSARKCKFYIDSMAATTTWSVWTTPI